MSNVFKYAVSGGFLAVAFGVLGAMPAQAKPVAVDAGGKARPAPVQATPAAAPKPVKPTQPAPTDGKGKAQPTKSSAVQNVSGKKSGEEKSSSSGLEKLGKSLKPGNNDGKTKKDKDSSSKQFEKLGKSLNSSNGDGKAKQGKDNTKLTMGGGGTNGDKSASKEFEKLGKSLKLGNSSGKTQPSRDAAKLAIDGNRPFESKPTSKELEKLGKSLKAGNADGRGKTQPGTPSRLSSNELEKLKLMPGGKLLNSVEAARNLAQSAKPGTAQQANKFMGPSRVGSAGGKQPAAAQLDNAANAVRVIPGIGPITGETLKVVDRAVRVGAGAEAQRNPGAARQLQKEKDLATPPGEQRAGRVTAGNAAAAANASRAASRILPVAPISALSVPGQGINWNWPWCHGHECDGFNWLFNRSLRYAPDPAEPNGKVIKPKDDDDWTFGAEGELPIRKGRILTADGQELGKVSFGADGKFDAGLIDLKEGGGFKMGGEGFFGVRTSGPEAPNTGGPLVVSGVPEASLGFKAGGNLEVGPKGAEAKAEVGAAAKAALPEFEYTIGPFKIKAQPEGMVGTAGTAEGSWKREDDKKMHLKGKLGVAAGTGGSLGLDISMAD
ncbi:hypothetical protein [Amycolatopsis sp. NPDC059657]|uniref:hypothetical protein n=1 Tax=Amycolatopsis sp. NPDC059657 TaxID=3346899 RepID=UPI0036716DF3